MIKEAKNAADRQLCLDLRMQVFVQEQGIALEDEIDDLDDVASHFLAYSDDTALGTARIIWKDETAKIGRLCVSDTVRGSGLGVALVQHCIDVARTRPDITRAELGAQCHAIGFYEKLGFTVFGPIYDDAGIDHRDMQLVFS